MQTPNLYQELTEKVMDLCLRDGVIDPDEREVLACVSDLALRAQAIVGLATRTRGVSREVRRADPPWLADLDRDYPPAA